MRKPTPLVAFLLGMLLIPSSGLAASWADVIESAFEVSKEHLDNDLESMRRLKPYRIAATFTPSFKIDVGENQPHVVSIEWDSRSFMLNWFNLKRSEVDIERLYGESENQLISSTRDFVVEYMYFIYLSRVSLVWDQIHRTWGDVASVSPEGSTERLEAEINRDRALVQKLGVENSMSYIKDRLLEYGLQDDINVVDLPFNIEHVENHLASLKSTIRNENRLRETPPARLARLMEERRIIDDRQSRWVGIAPVIYAGYSMTEGKSPTWSVDVGWTISLFPGSELEVNHRTNHQSTRSSASLSWNRVIHQPSRYSSLSFNNEADEISDVEAMLNRLINELELMILQYRIEEQALNLQRHAVDVQGVNPYLIEQELRTQANLYGYLFEINKIFISLISMLSTKDDLVDNLTRGGIAADA